MVMGAMCVQVVLIFLLVPAMAFGYVVKLAV